MTPPSISQTFSTLFQASQEAVQAVGHFITTGEAPSCPESGPTLCRVSDAMAREASRPLRADLPPNPQSYARRFLENVAPMVEGLLWQRPPICPREAPDLTDHAIAIGLGVLIGSPLPLLRVWPGMGLLELYCTSIEAADRDVGAHKNQGPLCKPGPQISFHRTSRIGTMSQPSQSADPGQEELLECR